MHWLKFDSPGIVEVSEHQHEPIKTQNNKTNYYIGRWSFFVEYKNYRQYSQNRGKQNSAVQADKNEAQRDGNFDVEIFRLIVDLATSNDQILRLHYTQTTATNFLIFQITTS